jgi:predicted RNA-binding Zn-ribbon protein involved in translation (DUF1610 family)
VNTLQNIREILKIIKHRKPAKKYCPRCGSPKIRLSSGLDYGLTPKKYVCGNCGYMGPLVMELEKEEEN